MTDELESTMSRALADSERASIEAAQQAFERGYINQRETAPGSGVYRLSREIK